MPIFTPVIPTITLLAQLTVEYGTLTRRRSLAVHCLVRLASLVFVYGGYLLLGRLGVDGFVPYYLLTVAYLAACVALFAESLSQKLFMYFTTWGVATFLSSLCHWIARWVAGEDEIPLRYLLYLGSYVAILPPYLLSWRRRVREMLALFAKGNPAYAAYPFLAFVLFSALFGPAIDSIPPGRFVAMVLFEAIVLFSYYLLFSQVRAAVDRAGAESRLREAERLALLQKRYYGQVELGIRTQRELLHDARHHLTAVVALAEAGDCAGIDAYVRPLLERYSSPGPLRYCENEVANAVIGGRIRMAEEMGIAVSVELDLPRDLGIDPYDLCTLFGNAIENAIEACERAGAGSGGPASTYIGVKSKASSGRLVVRIENSCGDPPRREWEGFRSSKGERGGAGLVSLRHVVERHGGCLDLQCREGVFVLSAVLFAEGAAPAQASSGLVSSRTRA